MLQTTRLSRNLVEVVTSTLKEAWTMRVDQQTDQPDCIAKQIKDADERIEGLPDKLADSESATVTKALEWRIESAGTRKTATADTQGKSSTPKRSFEEAFERAARSPVITCNIYVIFPKATKKMILGLAFKAPIVHDLKNGRRTPQVADELRVIEPNTLEY